MVETNIINPCENQARCEEYLCRSLPSRARLIHAEPLTASTRAAPWRLDAEVDGVLRRYVLRLGSKRSEHEYMVLRAMESVQIPTPRAYGWDPTGETFGEPCFLCDFIEGESLLGPVLAGERWAEDLYIDTVCDLQSITREQLAALELDLEEGETAQDVLEAAYDYFRANPHPVAEAVYAKLSETMPSLPTLLFSNGDLWLDNFVVRNGQLAGVIDFETAGFSDPIFEFLLSFFVSPELRGRGIEERYCQRMGFDPAALTWYRGLEYLDTWRCVMSSGEPFVHHTAENLPVASENWLAGQ
jgi:aminoglycoside phosphotransferase (APT) family kinase protein